MALTVKQVKKAIEQKDGNVSEVAESFGVDRSTIYRKIQKHKELKIALEDAREKFVDFTESKLKSEVRKGNITAIIFTLKTIGKHRGYVERQEYDHSGSINLMVSWDDDTNDNA